MKEDINAAVDAAVARIKREQETKEALAKAATEYRAERERKEKVPPNGPKANGHDAGNKTSDNVTSFNWRDHVFSPPPNCSTEHFRRFLIVCPTSFPKG